jgi:N-acetylneuraminic acid mutarotase
MNQRSRSLFNSPCALLVAFASLFSLTLLVFQPTSAAQIEAQQTTWTTTGSLGTARAQHTATLLANGKVLVVGGLIGCNPGCQTTNSVEIYDPSTSMWSATGSPSLPRGNHIAVRLANGKVLVAGGYSAPGVVLAGSELFDPDTGTWSPTGALGSARQFHTAALLPDGRVLITGGLGADFSVLSTAELYDPAIGSWSSAGTMNSARVFHTTTLLNNGEVLVAAGSNTNLPTPPSFTPLRSAELYDPTNGSWTATGDLITARVVPSETLLPNGKVLIAGGGPDDERAFDKAEVYDPVTGQWSATGSMTVPRAGHTATLLPSGRVLIAAGYNKNNLFKSAELYDPATETCTAIADLNTARAIHSATLLSNGKALVACGYGDAGQLTSAELFDSTTPVPRITGASVSGKKLIVEGDNFDEGAKVLLNDQPQKTANETATTVLRCKKAGKQIEPGATVRLKVRNADGTESAEFSFTRPVE